MAQFSQHEDVGETKLKQKGRFRRATKEKLFGQKKPKKKSKKKKKEKKKPKPQNKDSLRRAKPSQSGKDEDSLDK